MVSQYPDTMVYDQAYSGGGFTAISDPIPAVTMEVTSRCRIESKSHPRIMGGLDSAEFKEAYEVFLPVTASYPLIGTKVQLVDRAGNMIAKRALKSIVYGQFSIKITI